MRKFTIISLILASVLPLSSCIPSMKCSIAQTDITPVDNVVLAGFAARQGLSDGIHHPLLSTALVIADGSEKVCIITNDLMEVATSQVDDILARISKESGLPVDRIFFHCIHTHSAPRSGGASNQPGGPNVANTARMFDLIVANAVKAITAPESEWLSFRLQVARGSSVVNRNRCEKGGPMDHSLLAYRLVGRNNQTIATMVNFACHPVALNHCSHVVSSDFPGVTRDIISHEWKGGFLYFSGAQGNANPAEGSSGTTEKVDEMGARFAHDLAQLQFEDFSLRGGLKVINRTAKLPYVIDKVTVEAINELAKNTSTFVDSKTWPEDLENWRKIMVEKVEKNEMLDYLPMNIAAINLGGAVLFLSQGEPFAEYQMSLREAFPQIPIFFIGYTNGQNSYLASDYAYQSGSKGYAYETEQMHVYIKAPYPLSPQMPKVYNEEIISIIDAVLGNEPAPKYDIIPQPQKLTKAAGYFEFDTLTDIAVETTDTLFQMVARDFAATLAPATGLNIPVGTTGDIVFRQVEGMGEEAYKMEVRKGRITIEASTAHGAFYATRSLLQLLPTKIFSKTPVENVRWIAGCCHIEDSPEFAFRGMLVDCARHFHPKDKLKEYIDVMALQKMNSFHWHLTDDQGWRIEIKKYPLLTEVGAWRKETKGYAKKGDGVPHGGYYTQDDVREVVEYARHRFVEVIPEIELPGHSAAAIAAYPWLSCTPDEPKEVATTWGIKKDVYIPSERTFQFLEDVFTELFDLFPSRYYHIGGDECPRDAWRKSEFCQQLMKEKGFESEDEIQIYMVRRIDEFLRAHGKTVIGWDEIIEGGAVKSTVVLSYRGHKPANRAVRREMNTILTPDRWTYLNYPDLDIEKAMNINTFLPLKKIYDWYPIGDTVEAEYHKYYLGLQCCIWGEVTRNTDILEREAFPRTFAIAEVGWTSRENKNWDSFRERTATHIDRVRTKGLLVSPAFENIIFKYDYWAKQWPKELVLELDAPATFIHFTTDGSRPTMHSPIYEGTFRVSEGDVVRAQGFTAAGVPVGREGSRTFSAGKSTEKGENDVEIINK